MIKKIEGDITHAKGYILHGVNCQGVMGAGIAKVIAQKWPIVYDDYKSYCGFSLKDCNLLLGKYLKTQIDEETAVINLFTQIRYGTVSGEKYVHYDALDKSLRDFSNKERLSMSGNIKVNFPKIGAGLGGGNWNVLKEIIDHRIPDNVEKILYVLGG